MTAVKSPRKVMRARAAILDRLSTGPCDGRRLAMAEGLASHTMQTAIRQMRDEGLVRDTGQRAGNWKIWEKVA